MKLFRKISAFFGRPGYQLDNQISPLELFFLSIEIGLRLFRGLLYNLFFNFKFQNLFLDRNVTIKNKRKLYLGKNVTLKKGVYINAFVKEKIIIGEGSSLHENTVIEGYGGIRNLGVRLIIGKNVGFSNGCFIQVRGPVIIDSGTIFGPGVKIFSESHNFHDLSTHFSNQGETRIGVRIGSNCWIGANTIILDGSVIEDNVIVGAGSLVKGNLLRNSIYVGSPVRHLRKRN